MDEETKKKYVPKAKKPKVQKKYGIVKLLTPTKIVVEVGGWNTHFPISDYPNAEIGDKVEIK